MPDERASVFDVPDWLMDQLAKWNERLGLAGYRIRVEMANIPHDTYQDADASTAPKPLYNRATVRFRIGFPETAEGENTVIHELMHVAHARIDQFVEHVLIPGLPESAQEMASEAYAAVNEPFIQQMADNFMALQDELTNGKKKQ